MGAEIQFPGKRQEILSFDEVDKVIRLAGMSDPVSRLDKSLFKGKDLELVNTILSYLKETDISAEFYGNIRHNAIDEEFRNYRTIDLLLHTTKLQDLQAFLSIIDADHYEIPRGIRVKKGKTIINLFYERPEGSPKYNEDIDIPEILGYYSGISEDSIPKDHSLLEEQVTKALYCFLDDKAYCILDEVPMKAFDVGHSELDNTVYIKKNHGSSPQLEIDSGEMPAELSANAIREFLESAEQMRRTTVWTTPDNINIVCACRNGSRNYSFLMLHSYQTPVLGLKHILEKVIKDSQRKYNAQLDKQ